MFLAIGTLQIHPVIKSSPHFQNGRHFLHIDVIMLNQVNHRISNIDQFYLTIFLTKRNVVRIHIVIITIF